MQTQPLPKHRNKMLRESKTAKRRRSLRYCTWSEVLKVELLKHITPTEE